MSDATKPGADAKGTPEQLAAERESATKAERARIQGITSCEEAKGRESLANHLAFNTTMSADDAKVLLAAAPKAEGKPTGTANPLAQAMAASNQPNVGADTQAAAAEGQATVAQGILAAARAAGVRSYEVPAKH